MKLTEKQESVLIESIGYVPEQEEIDEAMNLYSSKLYMEVKALFMSQSKFSMQGRPIPKDYEKLKIAFALLRYENGEHNEKT